MKRYKTSKLLALGLERGGSFSKLGFYLSIIKWFLEIFLSKSNTELLSTPIFFFFKLLIKQVLMAGSEFLRILNISCSSGVVLILRYKVNIDLFYKKPGINGFESTLLKINAMKTNHITFCLCWVIIEFCITFFFA